NCLKQEKLFGEVQQKLYLYDVRIAHIQISIRKNNLWNILTNSISEDVSTIELSQIETKETLRSTTEWTRGTASHFHYIISTMALSQTLSCNLSKRSCSSNSSSDSTQLVPLPCVKYLPSDFKIWNECSSMVRIKSQHSPIGAPDMGISVKSPNT
uniref:Uncharacterized protein n=1 Tax=Glossina palpalis gambiensis TaxID=67801 RepID=A0A1B0AR26_9MUSC